MRVTQHTINTPYMVGPVHCYTTEIDGALVLFDTGPPTEPAKEYFLNHDYKRVRAAKGMLFLKELTLKEFYDHSIELKKLTENV